LILIVPLLLLTLNKVHGQEAGGSNIELSPAKINVTVDPGESFTQTFRVGNYSGSPQTLYIFMRDFTVINERGTPDFFEHSQLDEDARRFALSQWVELPSDSITIANNEVMEVDAEINIPEDAEAGGHYGAFFVRTQAPEAEGTGVGSVVQITSLMLINVPGDIEESVIITEAYTEKSIYWEESPEITLVTLLKNEGSVHGIPVGAFTVSGGRGAKTKSVIYNQNQGAVLPGAPERRITETFSLDKKEGSLIPPIGKFTIELVARYGTTNLPLETTLNFWLLPARFLAVSGLLGLVGIFILWRVLKSFKK
jgi:hypothetical protein